LGLSHWAQSGVGLGLGPGSGSLGHGLGSTIPTVQLATGLSGSQYQLGLGQSRSVWLLATACLNVNNGSNWAFVFISLSVRLGLVWGLGCLSGFSHTGSIWLGWVFRLGCPQFQLLVQYNAWVFCLRHWVTITVRATGSWASRPLSVHVHNSLSQYCHSSGLGLAVCGLGQSSVCPIHTIIGSLGPIILSGSVLWLVFTVRLSTVCPSLSLGQSSSGLSTMSGQWAVWVWVRPIQLNVRGWVWVRLVCLGWLSSPSGLAQLTGSIFVRLAGVGLSGFFTTTPSVTIVRLGWVTPSGLSTKVWAVRHKVSPGLATGLPQ